MPDEQQIAEALADVVKRSPSPQKCWAQYLDEEPFQFLLALEKLEREGDYVGRAKATEKFADLFGIDISRGQMSYHLIKSCSCKKERDY